MSKEYDYLLKIVLRGSRRVGKQSILNYLVGELKNQNLYLSNRDFSIRSIKVDQLSIKIQVWDLALFERFRSIIQKLIKQANIIIFIFDLTNEESFEDVTYYIDELKDAAYGKISKILVGNKCDLEPSISNDKIQTRALELGLTYLEISVKTGLNLDLLFEIVCRDYIYKN